MNPKTFICLHPNKKYRSTWSFNESVWKGAKHLTQRTAINKSLAAVSCIFSHVGVTSKDPFAGPGDVSVVDVRIFPESDDFRENPLPFSDEAGDKRLDENGKTKDDLGGGGITFWKGDGNGEWWFGLNLSIFNWLDLLKEMLRSMLSVSFLFHKFWVLSAIIDSSLKIKNSYMLNTKIIYY